MRSEIVLIGPVGVGKSTLAALLSKKLGLPVCSLDDLRWKYYEEIGYDRATDLQILSSEGFAGVYEYWKQYEIHSVERVFADYRDCVFDFGAGHSVYEDGEHFARAAHAFAPFDNVFLILPHPDPEESMSILRRSRPERTKWLEEENPGLHEELQRRFVTHHSNHRLAKHAIYTDGKSPKQSRNEILSAMS